MTHGDEWYLLEIERLSYRLARTDDEKKIRGYALQIQQIARKREALRQASSIVANMEV